MTLSCHTREKAKYRERSIVYRSRRKPSIVNSHSRLRPSFSMIRVEAVFSDLAMEMIRSSRVRSNASRSAVRAASVARPRPQYRRASHHPISGSGASRQNPTPQKPIISPVVLATVSTCRNLAQNIVSTDSPRKSGSARRSKVRLPWILRVSDNPPRAPDFLSAQT